MGTIKKAFRAGLAICGLFFMSPVLFAQFTYVTNGGDIILTEYNGSGGVVSISNFVTSVGEGAFYGEGLTGVTIPNSVTSIGEGAFYSNSLTSVAISASVTSIGVAPFGGCHSLTAIMVDAQNAFYSSSNGAVFDKAKTTLIQYPGGKSGSYTVPGSVTHIGEAAFELNDTLVSVTVPGSVTNLGDYAFYFCRGLTSVFFTGNAPTADSSVFYADPATAYYLPGTTGWSNFSANTGLPVVLWNPSIQTTNGSFGIHNNQFGFTITGTANIPIVVQASSNLSSGTWTPVQSCTLTNGSIYFSDPAGVNSPSRFYTISFP